MRDTLIVLNYQREIPPFAQTVLYHADKVFQRVVYVTPQLYNDNRDACRCEKLQVEQISRGKRIKKLLKMPAFLLQKETVKQIKVAAKHKGLNGKFAKNLLAYGICGDMLFERVKQMIEAGDVIPGKSVILAAWFHVEAFAGSKLKKAYPALRVVSYAHAFEINEAVNKQAFFSMNMCKHSGCDEIAFIAKTTQQRYLSKLTTIYPHLQTDNVTVKYLGSEKLFPQALAQRSGDGILRLVSCSSAVEVKRIHLIVDALEQSNARIHWTHMGGGPLLKQLEQYAQEKLSGKEHITYTFTGALKNSQVHRWYLEEPVDLFVNVSESEGLPVSIMESLSYGVPAIATDVGGTKEIVTEETGFILPKDFAVNQLTELMEAYGALDEQSKRNYGKQANAFWVENLDATCNAVAFLSRQIQQ